MTKNHHNWSGAKQCRREHKLLKLEEKIKHLLRLMNTKTKTKIFNKAYETIIK